jgi:outer membrane immunogenic protein
LIKGLITAIAAAALILPFNVVSGHAADLPTPLPYVSPVVPPQPVYSWTGIYLGVNGGYGFGQYAPMSLFSSDFSAFSYNANGWLGGVTAGAQIQASHTVLGLEADIDWANITGSSSGTINFNGAPIGTATLSSTLSSVSTARARVGYGALAQPLIQPIAS